MVAVTRSVCYLGPNYISPCFVMVGSIRSINHFLSALENSKKMFYRAVKEEKLATIFVAIFNSSAKKFANFSAPVIS